MLQQQRQGWFASHHSDAACWSSLGPDSALEQQKLQRSDKTMKTIDCWDIYIDSLLIQQVIIQVNDFMNIQ